MLVDSHCHLHLLDLKPEEGTLDEVVAQAQAAGIEHLLNVSVDLEDFEIQKQLADRFSFLSFSVGLHPSSRVEHEPTVDQLIQMANHPRCIAIGETGLDYYYGKTDEDKHRQRTRLATHVQAAVALKKPLIIHTRDASHDTLQVLDASGAASIGGVMHCFTESWDFAQKAMAMNFYISFSGIVTFKNADALREVARQVPLDRILIETDSPYLAPVPHRGKKNQPAYVHDVAEFLSQWLDIPYETFAQITTENFYRCFHF